MREATRFFCAYFGLYKRGFRHYGLFPRAMSQVSQLTLCRFLHGHLANASRVKDSASVLRGTLILASDCLPMVSTSTSKTVRQGMIKK